MVEKRDPINRKGETISEWLQRCPNFRTVNSGIYVRLAERPEMREVWRWFSNNRTRLYGSEVSLATAVVISTRYPSKPGNLAPKERSQYLQKVERHTRALIELLSGTRYDADWIDREIPEDELEARVLRDLTPSDSEEVPDFIHSYLVTQEQVFKLSWDYPNPQLVELLGEVVRWTQDDDYWSRDPIVSSTPITQYSNTITTSFFNRTLFAKLSRQGLNIPFPILATLCNVALDLSPDQLVNEETVRKQIRRNNPNNKIEFDPAD